LLGAQDAATQQIQRFQWKIAEIENWKVPGVPQFMKHFNKIKYQLPALREAIVSATSMRDETWAGELDEVQGLIGPRGFIDKLPGDPSSGFGGRIFDIQNSLRELGLKTTSEPSDSERASLLEQLLREANQRTATSDAQKVALEGWDEMRRGLYSELPRFHEGGRIMGSPHREVPILAKVGETVLSEEDTGRLERAIDGGSGGLTIEQLVIHEDGRATVRFEGREFDAAVERVTRKSRGVGVLTPGGARR